MMFIDVTRYGGMRIQRLAVGAIAYLDAVEGGCAIHLLGGETLRVNEDLTEIEARSSSLKIISAVEADGKRIEYSPAIPAPRAAPAIKPRDASQYPAKRGNNRSGR